MLIFAWSASGGLSENVLILHSMRPNEPGQRHTPAFKKIRNRRFYEFVFQSFDGKGRSYLQSVLLMGKLLRALTESFMLR